MTRELDDAKKDAIRFNDYTHFDCGHVVGKPWPSPPCPICAEISASYSRAKQSESALAEEREKVKRLVDALYNENKRAAMTEQQVLGLQAQKNIAYSERNKLVAALSKFFPASLERHPDDDKDWENDWRWIVFINLPTGQVSWHLHDSELQQFEHLPRIVGRKWDGHTTDEKYARLKALSTTPESALAEVEARYLEKVLIENGWLHNCSLLEQPVIALPTSKFKIRLEALRQAGQKEKMP